MLDDEKDDEKDDDIIFIQDIQVKSHGSSRPFPAVVKQEKLEENIGNGSNEGGNVSMVGENVSMVGENVSNVDENV